MKKIIIFGGTGFIGSHVAENLLSKGYQVTLADRLFPVNTPASLLEKISLAFCDIKDRTQVSDLMFQHNGGINLAGILGTSETVDDPYPSVETNVLGGLNFLQACRQHKKRGVQIAVGNHFMNNSYAITKTTTERFALMYNKEHGTQIAVVRGLNAYGERQHHAPVRKIIPNFIVRALKGVPIEVYGDGSQIMDMIYVKDLAEVLVRALTEDHGVYDKIFEAGTGRETTVQWIAGQVNRVAGNKAGIKNLPMRAGEPEKSIVKGDPYTLIPLGLTPSQLLSFEEGILRTVEWYKENYDYKST
jgi:nucleoside-diphosphate-sugar epimerase